MSLTDQQIERYSRQIIVPGFGARGQERILATRLRLVGASGDIAAVAPYLIGAGFGAISVGTSGPPDLELENFAGLNTDCAITFDTRDTAVDLALMIIGDAASLEFARSEVSRAPGQPMVLARLDRPARLVITPAPPQYPRCLLVLEAPFSNRVEAAATIAMAAVTETIKLAASSEPAAEPVLIVFDGYNSRCLALEAPVDPCPCSGCVNR